MFQGLKRKRNHAGILDNYTWNKETCIEEINSYPDNHPINFSDLARRHNLKNNRGMILYLYMYFYADYNNFELHISVLFDFFSLQ